MAIRQTEEEKRREDKFAWKAGDIKFIVEPGAAKPATKTKKTVKKKVSK